MSRRTIELPPVKVDPEPKVAAIAPKPKDKPAQPPAKRLPRARRRRRPGKRPPAERPSGQPKASEKAPDTGEKVFGLELESTATAPAGQGVEVPAGESTVASPKVTQKGGPVRGFKKSFEVGELAPIAVVTSRPVPLSRVEPDYPQRVRELGIEGRVVLELTVTGEGTVSQTRYLRRLHPLLDAACRRAARKMRFRPATVNGTPVTVKIPYSFAFVLD